MSSQGGPRGPSVLLDAKDNTMFPPSQAVAPPDAGGIGYEDLPDAGLGAAAGDGKPAAWTEGPDGAAPTEKAPTEMTALGNGGSAAGDAYPPGENGVFSSVILLAKTVLGAGTLSLPFAFKGVGVGLGTMLLLIMYGLSTMSCLVLAETRSLVRDVHHSFGGVAHVAFGKWGTIATHIVVCLGTYGACLAYFILIGDLVSPPIGYWLGDTPDDYCSAWGKRQIPILFGLIIEVALCLLPSLHALRHAATLAIASMLYLVFVVVITSSKDLKDSASDPFWPDGNGKVRGFTFTTDIFKSISIITFAFTCQFNLMPVLNELREPTTRRKRKVSMGTMVLCASVYGLVGAFGYLTFYDDTKGNLLLNFEADNTAVTIGRLCVCIAIMAGYPLVMRACVTSLDALFFPGRSQVDRAFVWGRRLGWLTVCIGSTFGIALAIEDVSLVLGLSGASASTCISYVIPGSVFLKLHYRRHPGAQTKWTAMAWACLLIGTTFGLVATGMAVKDIVDGDDKDDCIWHYNDTEKGRCCPDNRGPDGYTPW